VFPVCRPKIGRRKISRRLSSRNVRGGPNTVCVLTRSPPPKGDQLRLRIWNARSVKLGAPIRQQDATAHSIRITCVSGPSVALPAVSITSVMLGVLTMFPAFLYMLRTFKTYYNVNSPAKPLATSRAQVQSIPTPGEELHPPPIHNLGLVDVRTLVRAPPERIEGK